MAGGLGAVGGVFSRVHAHARVGRDAIDSEHSTEDSADRNAEHDALAPSRPLADGQVRVVPLHLGLLATEGRDAAEESEDLGARVARARVGCAGLGLGRTGRG